MQIIQILELICFVGWLFSIAWKYFSRHSMSSLLVQLVLLVSLLFFQTPKVLDAILYGNSYKGILCYMVFILINIFVNGHHIEERAKKYK